MTTRHPGSQPLGGSAHLTTQDRNFGVCTNDMRVAAVQQMLLVTGI
jgi:hypothetical protein